VRLCLLAFDDDPELACLLVGTRDALLVQSGMAIEPLSIRQRDQVIERAKQQLGATRTAEKLVEGERLTVPDAIDLALGRAEAPSASAPKR
jgi:hypothetical protein